MTATHRFANSSRHQEVVVPAEAGIHDGQSLRCRKIGPGFRRDNMEESVFSLRLF
jgi:hypothetical protein